MARRKTGTETTQNSGVTAQNSSAPPIGERDANDSNIATSAQSDEEFTFYIQRAEAKKLNPSSDGLIYFQLARHKVDKALYLRIDDNDGGGLHSREWIPLLPVIDLLCEQRGKAFKSTILKPCIRGKSSNNASFLAAALRSPALGLIQASEKGVFNHVLSESFNSLSKALLNRKS